MTISEFETLLEQKDSLCRKKSQKMDILSKFYARLRRLKSNNSENEPLSHPVLLRIKEVSKKFHEHWDDRIYQYGHVIYLSALTLEIPKADDFLDYKTVSASSYSSQGFGACHYAKSAAMEYVDKALYYGLEAKVEEINTQTIGPHCIQYADYVVKVKTTKTGLEILDQKPEVPLVERVRLCWRRGTNPRVFMYWLPYDFEAKNGLDYFGNYIDKADLKV